MIAFCIASDTPCDKGLQPGQQGADDKLPLNMCSRGSATRSIQSRYTHLRPLLLQSTDKGIMEAASLFKRATRHKLSTTPFQEVQHLLQIGRADVVLRDCNAFLQDMIRKPSGVYRNVGYEQQKQLRGDVDQKTQC